MLNTWKKLAIATVASALPIGVFLALPMGTWADVSALPAHPLIVHGVIVALPVAAVWLLLAVWKPQIFKRTHVALLSLSVLGALGVIAAKSSGDSLAAAVGLPDSHADAGNRMFPVSIAMTVSVLLFAAFSLVRPIRAASLATRGVAALIAVAILPLTYLAGHSGAESVWEEEYQEAQQPISLDSLTLSMAEVSRHSTANDCWTVVEGNVYDMTTFIQRHPAGAGDIVDMCGKDATDDFMGEHNGQKEPEKWLATLKIGVVSG